MYQPFEVLWHTFVRSHSKNNPLDTVPLNYNFILTRVSTSGATKYFACQMPEFPVEIQISTTRDVAFRRGIYMRRGTWHFTRDGIVTFTHDVVVLTKLNNWQDSICL